VGRGEAGQVSHEQPCSDIRADPHRVGLVAWHADAP
jgi:hypothetical protein